MKEIFSKAHTERQSQTGVPGQQSPDGTVLENYPVHSSTAQLLAVNKWGQLQFYQGLLMTGLK